MDSSLKKFIIYFPGINNGFQQFSCSCRSVLYQRLLTQVCVFPTSCYSEVDTYHPHTVSFQFNRMTPKKVESSSIEMRAFGRKGITSSSSSSWSNCTVPVKESTQAHLSHYNQTSSSQLFFKWLFIRETSEILEPCGNNWSSFSQCNISISKKPFWNPKLAES